MGTIFASKYTILTIGHFEVHLYGICEVKWGIDHQDIHC